MTTGAIRVVVHRDTAATSKRLRGLGQRHDVVVADLLDPCRADMFAFADAVLDGMGKTEDVYTLKRRTEPLCAAWITTSTPIDIIVPDSQLLDPDSVVEAARWLAGLGADVWLCCATRSPQHPNEATAALSRHVLPHTDAEQVDITVLDERLAARPSAQPAEPPDWPRVPRVDGFSFREACRRLLDPPDFARADGEFLSNATRLFKLLPEPFTQRAKARKLWPMLRDEIRAADDTEHLIIVVRAAQVALLLRGWLLRVDTAMLLGAAGAQPRLGEHNASGRWDQFEAYRDPDPGAVTSLYLAGIDPELIRHLAVGRIDTPPDPRTPLVIRTADGDITVDNAGVRFLRTLTVYRQLCGAGADEALLETHRAPMIEKRQLNRLLTVAGAEVGVPVIRGRITSAQPAPQSFVKRYGLTLRWLPMNRGRIDEEPG